MKTRRPWPGSSAYAVAASEGCPRVAMGFEERPERPGVLMHLFTNAAEDKWVWVGYDERRRVYLIHEGREPPTNEGRKEEKGQAHES